MSRTGEERRRSVCVCVRQAETGGQRRRFGTFGEQPGGGAQRGTGMRQHPSADSRAAACGPTGEGRTGRTHTAPAVTHSLPAACVCESSQQFINEAETISPIKYDIN